MGADAETARKPVPYERDYYSWTQQQAELLDQGRLDFADAANIAEELRDMGREQFQKLESALEVLLAHMLQWDYQPEKRTRSSFLTIIEQRKRLDLVLSRNPGLRGRLQDAVEGGYQLARVAAARETELRLRSFPEECPYLLDEIRGREFTWPQDD